MDQLLSTKKNISQEWLNAFPQLSSYKVTKLYTIVGPFILGIELQPTLFGSKEYRPYFVGYSLWDTNEDDCMLGPMFIKEIMNREGRKFWIPYLDYEEGNREAIECTKEVIKTSLDINVKIDDLLLVINNILNESYSIPILQYLIKFYYVLYLDDSNLIDEVLNEIINVSQEWPQSIFEFRYGTREQFIEKLKNDIVNRESFLSQIKLNQSCKKFKKLKISDLVY